MPSSTKAHRVGVAQTVNTENGQAIILMGGKYNDQDPNHNVWKMECFASVDKDNCQWKKLGFELELRRDHGWAITL